MLKLNLFLVLFLYNLSINCFDSEVLDSFGLPLCTSNAQQAKEHNVAPVKRMIKVNVKNNSKNFAVLTLHGNDSIIITEHDNISTENESFRGIKINSGQLCSICVTTLSSISLTMTKNFKTTQLLCSYNLGQLVTDNPDMDLNYILENEIFADHGYWMPQVSVSDIKKNQ